MKNTNLNNEQITNPLSNPLNHSIEDLLKEIQFGRPAETQLLIQSWIDELPQQKLLGKTISIKDAKKDSFEDVTKYKRERSYSEEDIALAFNEGQAYSVTGKLVDGKEWLKAHKKEWFEQFKNK